MIPQTVHVRKCNNRCFDIRARTNAITLKDGLAVARVGGEAMKTHTCQGGEFAQMENSIRLLKKDDGLVPFFLLQKHCGSISMPPLSSAKKTW